MSIKLKDRNGTVRIYNNASVIKLKDENDNDVLFTKSLHQKTTFIAKEGDFYSAQENGEGVATTIPVEPTRTGYIFKGWSEVSHELNMSNKVFLPKVYNADQTLYGMWLETPSGGATVDGLGSSSNGEITYIISDSFTAFLQDLQDGNYEETDAYNNVFVKIPTIYRKVQMVEDNQIVAIALSLTQIDSTYKPYPCFVKADGVTVMPYILIGKYCMSSTTEANSVNATKVSMTIGAGRSLAQARGTGYQLYDWQMQRLFQDLVICYKKTVDVNQDSLLGIEHLAGGIWIDGIARNNSQWLCCYDPTKYVDSPTWTSNTVHTDGYSQVGYSAPTSSGQEIKKLGYDSNHPFFNYPSETINNGSYNTYYYDGYWYQSGNRPVLSGVSGSNAHNGLWGCGTDLDWTYALGVRLCYRPIA